MTASHTREANNPACRACENRHCVLLVDDDPASRSSVHYTLLKLGYEVYSAPDARAAMALLAKFGSDAFHCVVTDHQMPEVSGLELMAWIRAEDPTLSTVLLTAGGEKELVAASLREGAVDFLEKPAGAEKLRDAITRAAKQTERQRALAASDTAVKKLGQAQDSMLHCGHDGSPVRTEVCYHPKHDAGGDYFTRFQPSSNQYVCLLTDVSGHDVQAAYVSAYFQGLVRGMLEQAAPVELIFSAFNRLLLEEWKDCRPAGGCLGESVAACAVSFDLGSRSATVLSHGTPAPVYWQPDGRARMLGRNGGFPLGWFSDFSAKTVVQSIATEGAISIWTDGLEELATKRGVSELSLAMALQRTQAEKRALPGVEEADDDILLADIHLSSKPWSDDAYRPVLLEQYPAHLYRDIDQWQDFWKRSIQLAAPDISDRAMHDVLLASREAVTNALLHGCTMRSEQSATFQAACSPAQKSLRITVSDPGPGHGFDVEQHEARAAAELIPDHWGLILIKQLATKMAVERQGAEIVLDFDWP